MDEGVPVIMFTAPNRGTKTLDGTHSFVVGMDPAYVIDPGPAIESYQQELARHIKRHGHRVGGILLSHSHPDHAPGANTLKRLLDAPVWASSVFNEDIARGLAVDHRYAPDQQFKVSDDLLWVLPAAGHAADHVIFWLEASRILFSGDTVLGTGTSLVAPPEGDMVEYMLTLEAMKRLDSSLIAPGHGPLIRHPETKLEEYLQHRRAREMQVLHALHDGQASVASLVDRIYVDLDPALHSLAHGSVEAQLNKLIVEGKVERIGSCFQLV